MLLTGGGPPEKDTTNIIDDMVRAIVPTIDFTLNNSWDSTGIVAKDMKSSSSNGVKEIEEPIPSTAIVEDIAAQNNILPTLSVPMDNIEIIIDSENISFPLKTPKIMEKIGKKHLALEKSTPSKKRRLSTVEKVDEEKELKIKKLKDSIAQQEHLHKLRVEAVEAEKQYWVEKKIIEKPVKKIFVVF